MVIALLCSAAGCPVGVEVFAGNTQDASTVPEKIAQLQRLYGLKEIIFVGDRGMITKAGPTSYPVLVTAGELLDLLRVPQSARERLKEGSDYKVKWTLEEQKQVQAVEEDPYQKQFETPTPVLK